MKKSSLYKICAFAAILLCGVFAACNKAPYDGQSGDKNVIVSSFAGTGMKGAADGPVSTATFYSPLGMVFDAAGNMYVVDSGNNKIRKISTSGIVSTFAGTGVSGSDNGPGTSATFNQPECIVIDAAGNLYVTDGNQIRKITPAGVVSTFAGSVQPGLSNGPVSAATFFIPGNMVMDGAGNIFVSDYGNNVIRKISKAGIVSTFAGSGAFDRNDGPALSASFNGVGGLAFDAAGNLYVADIYNCSIRKITAAGMVSTLAGTGNPGILNGMGINASFADPDGLIVNSDGNLYVADSANNLVRTITPGAVVTSFAGTGSTGVANGFGNVATFSTPQQVAKDAQGNIYVTDLANQLRKLSR